MKTLYDNLLEKLSVSELEKAIKKSNVSSIKYHLNNTFEIYGYSYVFRIVKGLLVLQYHSTDYTFRHDTTIENNNDGITIYRCYSDCLINYKIFIGEVPESVRKVIVKSISLIHELLKQKSYGDKIDKGSNRSISRG